MRGYITLNILLMIIVFCAGAALAGEAHVYTDQDLEKYSPKIISPSRQDTSCENVKSSVDKQIRRG